MGEKLSGYEPSQRYASLWSRKGIEGAHITFFYMLYMCRRAIYFLFTLFLLFLSYIFTCSATSIPNVKNMFGLSLVPRFVFWNVRVQNMPKMVVEILMGWALQSPSQRHKPSPTLGRQWNYHKCSQETSHFQMNLGAKGPKLLCKWGTKWKNEHMSFITFNNATRYFVVRKAQSPKPKHFVHRHCNLPFAPCTIVLISTIYIYIKGMWRYCRVTFNPTCNYGRCIGLGIASFKYQLWITKNIMFQNWGVGDT